MRIQYDGRRFRVAEVAGDVRPGRLTVGSAALRPLAAGGDVPAAHYHQKDDLVWAEFAGGKVRHGSLTGTCAPDGILRLAYCMVLATGDLVSGRCVSTPTVLDDGRIRLTEEWERFSPGTATGTSYLEEIR